MATKILVEVTFATLTNQSIIAVEIDEGSTIENAIRASGILDLYPQIDLSHNKVGIFSELKKISDKVYMGDRIEIYRNLLIDPKEVRREKAKKLHKLRICSKKIPPLA